MRSTTTFAAWRRTKSNAFAARSSSAPATPAQADNITDQELLREVMNTVGKLGQLGGSIRCVVSVSMLTEGWDANTVTHVLGIRAFGTQLLCEQVIGRALRRQSYDLNEDGLFNVEYADVFGIPFDFTAKPVVAPPQPPRETVQVKAVRPERDALEIRFPRVEGYRVELPEERLTADFNDDSILELSPDLVGPSITRNSGIIGEGVDLNLEHLGDMRPSTLLFHVTQRLLYTKWRDPGEEPKLHLFGQLKRITKQWLDTCLVCKGGTYPAQLMYQELADMACNRITAGITRQFVGDAPDQGPARSLQSHRLHAPRSLQHVARRPLGHQRPAAEEPHQLGRARQRLGGRVLPRGRIASQGVAYTKNHNLGLEVPYRYGSETRKYLPDFIVLVDDGHGPDDLLHLVVEIKGYRREDAKEKKSTMETYWVPGVNHLGTLRPLGVRRVHRDLPDRVRLRGQGRKRVQQDDRRPPRRSRRRKATNHGQESHKASARSVETLKHDEAKRKNIPTAEYQSVLEKEQQRSARRSDVPAQHRPRSAARLAREGRAGLERPRRPCAAALHPGKGPPEGADRRPAAQPRRSTSTTAGSSQPDLFADFNGIPKGVDKTEFYQHDQNWSNRMILGDSLQVMASLAEREGLRGKVQCIYLDPPYGIKFNSNFQWSTTSRDVKDGKADHITREPEQVKAFRDTWRDGIHSYLTYLRDRLTVARDLLTDSGSIFVQIGDENVHRVRAVMDEVFGDDNFVAQIAFKKTGRSTSELSCRRRRLHPLVCEESKQSSNIGSSTRRKQCDRRAERAIQLRRCRRRRRIGRLTERSGRSSIAA